MAKDGISGNNCPTGFPYKQIIDSYSVRYGVGPCLVAAIKMNETGLGYGPQTDGDISADGGHGIMQLTSSYPDDWMDAASNIAYAIRNFVVPAWQHWAGQGLQGDDLVRAIAATYNGGLGNAEAGHAKGDIDLYTTNRYGERCLENYAALVKGQIPGDD